MDTELFFAEDPSTIARAKEICSICPVQIPCLVEALERGEDDGVWGGRTPEERDRLMRPKPKSSKKRANSAQ